MFIMKRDTGSRSLFLLAIGASLLAVLHSLGLIVNEPDWLLGVNWVWVRKVPEFSWLRLALLLLVAAVWLAMLAWVLRKQRAWSRWQEAALLSGAILLTPLSQLAIAGQHRSQPLSVAFLKTVAISQGFFDEGAKIEDPVQFMQQHAERMPEYASSHVQTQPPGWPLAFWAVGQVWPNFPDVLDWVTYRLLRYDCLNPVMRAYGPAQISSAVLQMSILLWSGLGVLPLYLLGRNLFSAETARLAAVLYPLMPGFLVFQARFDVLYGVLALVAVWLTHHALTKDQWTGRVLLASLLVSLTFFGFGTLAIILLVNAFGLAWVWLWMRSWPGMGRLLRINLWIGLMFVTLWAGLWWAWKVSWWEWFATGRRIHHEARASYPVWPLFNLFDFGVFLGLPLMIWALAGAGAAVWRGIKGRPKRGDALILGWVIALFILDVSGEVKAETGRIWLFLMLPGVLIGAATLLETLKKRPRPGGEERWLTRRRLRHLVLILFGVQALVTGYFLGGRSPEVITPQARWQLPSSAGRLSYRLGESIALQGYEIDQGGDRVEVTLYWRALGRPASDYAAFVHLIQAGTMVAQSDGTPSEDGLATWCWVPGEVVRDVRALTGGAPDRGDREIGVGLYDYATGERLPVQPPVPDDMIRLQVAPE